jgi:hypothetical protein
VTRSTLCPVCGALLTRSAGSPGRRRNGWLYHLNVRHPGLPDRERSLLADRMAREERPIEATS